LLEELDERGIVAGEASAVQGGCGRKGSGHAG
jgi:hypothetical protein